MKFLVFFLILFFTDKVVANEKHATKTSIRAFLEYPFAQHAENKIRKKIRKYTLIHYMFWSGERYYKGRIRKGIWKGENFKVYSEFRFRPYQQIFCEWQFTF